jgi:hypothetical protein
MSHYTTQAVIANGPLENVPVSVCELLSRLSNGAGRVAVDSYLEEIDDDAREAALAGLLKYGIIEDVRTFDDERLRAEYLSASGNSVDEHGNILDDNGSLVGPYSGSLAVLYLEWVLNDEREVAAMSATIIVDATEDAGVKLYISWDDGFDDDVMSILQWLLTQLPDLDYIQVNAAMTCSRMRPDGFGGWSAVVTRDSVHWTHAEDGSVRAIRTLNNEVEDPEVLLSDLLDERWDETAMKQLCCRFIKEQGLDIEFVGFLQKVVVDADALSAELETLPADEDLIDGPAIFEDT